MYLPKLAVKRNLVNIGMTEIELNFPFLTGISYAGAEYVGVIANKDSQLITFYDLGSITCPDTKGIFIELGETWWWESNRLLPIDVFLHFEMILFRQYLKTFAMKDVEILFGPVVSLQDLITKRIKRRSIQLVRGPQRGAV